MTRADTALLTGILAVAIVALVVWVMSSVVPLFTSALAALPG